jgi:N-acetyltransferase
VTVAPFDIQPVLVGDKVTLRPLEAQDFDALYAVASDPEIWAMHPFPDRYQREVFEDFFEGAMASRGAFAVVDKISGKIIGSTRLANYVADTSEIEIGWTFYATAHWRNGTNRQVKALLLSHIFPHVNIVVFRVGASNLRSRTAVERLGARLALEYPFEYGGKSHDYVRYELTEKDAHKGAVADMLLGGSTYGGEQVRA